MAHRKAGGTARNLRDSNPQYLGIKLYDGEKTKAGSIIVRQRGTRILSGKNTDMGKDHTIFALKVGTVRFATTRRKRYDGTTVRKRIVHVDD
jgi:large subunit ribosomal protein L27